MAHRNFPISVNYGQSGRELLLLLLLLQLLRVSCGICGQEFATLQLFNANASIGIPISHFSSFAKAKAKECAQSTAQKRERDRERERKKCVQDDKHVFHCALASRLR